MIKVSVVTPTYNLVRAGRIDVAKRCMESVARLPMTEHIIVDGGSIDGTVDFVKQFSSTVISEKDSGIYDALNKGIKNATGEWVYVLGCDDYIADGVALQKVIHEIEGRDVDVVITPVMKKNGSASINLKSCLYSIPYCHQGVLMKKALIERLGGFDASLKLAGDYDLSLKAHLSGAKELVLAYTFAFYSCGGASSNWAVLHKEVTEVAVRRFALNNKEEMRFDKTRCLPIRVILPLLFHKRRIIRRGAIWQILRNIVFMLGGNQ